MKKILSLLISVLLITATVFASGKKEDQHLPEYTCSNSWTAGFAQLGGLDDIDNIAPANLTHPPEYEILPQDINEIMNSKLFIYSGYEVMMKTLTQDLLPEEKKVKVYTANDLNTIKEMAALISERAGTQKISQERIAKYEAMVNAARVKVKEMGLDNLKILCNEYQASLVEDIGLTVTSTFGPGEITPENISDANDNKYDIIIDNIHNILSDPLCEVSPDSKLIIWRNFPDNIEPDAMYNMINSNFTMLFDAYK